MLRVLSNLPRPDTSKEGDAAGSLRSLYQSFNALIAEVAGVFSLYIILETLPFQFQTIVSSPPALQLCESQALSSQVLLFNTGKLHLRSILSILLLRLNKSHSSSQKCSSSQLHSPLLVLHNFTNTFLILRGPKLNTVLPMCIFSWLLGIFDSGFACLGFLT